MLRHTALFLHRDTISDEQRLATLRGFAFLRMECAGVRAGDYGQDLFGGSSPLLAVPPWKRTPRWRARREGPPSNYDVALHLDFDDETALERYLADERRAAVARFSASINVPELTARIVWRYDGAPLIRRGLIRHTVLFVWTGEADVSARASALAAARGLGRAPGVLAAVAGENAGGPAANFDWVLDIQTPDSETARGLLESREYAGAMDVIMQATKYEWTARITHVMRGY